MPLSLITLAHALDSFAMYLASSSRDVGLGVNPCSVKEAITSLSFNTLTISKFQRSNKTAGVLLEATKAYQFVESKPG